MKEILFSVTRKDFRWDEFRAGGKGGQGQNKRSTGIRCVHPPSGAVGEGRDSRSQTQNKQNAFVRCVNSPKFQAWLRMETARKSKKTPEIDYSLRPENIKTELLINGEWVEE